MREAVEREVVGAQAKPTQMTIPEMFAKHRERTDNKRKWDQEAETILISSDSEPEGPTDQEVIPPVETMTGAKRRRARVQRCENCHDIKHKCSCGFEPSKGLVEDKVRLERTAIIEQTMNDPQIRSVLKQHEDMTSFLDLRLKNLLVQEVQPEKWLELILEWAEDRGRCQYASGEVGVAPGTAKKYFKRFTQVVKAKYDIDLVQKFPFLRKFVAKWQKFICGHKLYRRKQANYLTKMDVRNYIKVFEKKVLRVLDLKSTMLKWRK